MKTYVVASIMMTGAGATLGALGLVESVRGGHALLACMSLCLTGWNVWVATLWAHEITVPKAASPERELAS